MNLSTRKCRRNVRAAFLVSAGLAASALAQASLQASVLENGGTGSTASFTGSYTPNFSNLPYNTSGADFNAANPATLATDSQTGTSTVYALAGGGKGASGYYDFAAGIDSTATDAYTTSGGGLGLNGTGSAGLQGWYAGSVGGSAGPQYGTQNGDTTTGGIISFGPNSAGTSTRALGILSTGTTGYTYAGVELINSTGGTVNSVNVNFVYELWHQGKSNAQGETASYFVDNSASSGSDTNTILTAETAATALPGNSSVSAPAFGSTAAVDGTSAANQTDYSGTLTGLNWQQGGALWIIFSTTQNAGSGAGWGVQTDAAAGLSNPQAFVTLAAPEPASLGLLAVGALGLLSRRRPKA